MQNNSLTKRLQAFNAQLEEKVTVRTSDLVHKSDALSQKQQKFKSLYEYHPDPIFTIDLNGIFLNVNKAGSVLLGAPTDELLGETCFSIILDEDKHKLALALEKVKQQESASLFIHILESIPLHFLKTLMLQCMMQKQKNLTLYLFMTM